MSCCPICQTVQETDDPCQECAEALAEGRVQPCADGALGGPPYMIVPREE